MLQRRQAAAASFLKYIRHLPLQKRQTFQAQDVPASSIPARLVKVENLLARKITNKTSQSCLSSQATINHNTVQNTSQYGCADVTLVGPEDVAPFDTLAPRRGGVVTRPHASLINEKYVRY